jgi:predicted adenylyl cyclase CyaB
VSVRTESELKARLEESVEATCRRLEARGWRLHFDGEMFDRILDTPDRRLLAADEVLRVRRIYAGGEIVRSFLTWKGPTRYENGFKVRDELETPAADPAAMTALLARLGFTVVAMAIDRRITVYESGPVRARIEVYPGMDTLIEMEGDPEAVERRLDDVGLPRSAWVAWPLQEFVDRYETRTGEAARLAYEGSSVRR